MPSQNTIKCSKCGTLKGTTNVRLKKLVKKYGSKEKLEKLYVCRDCKGGNTTPAVGKTGTKKSKKSKLPTSKVICSKCKGKFGTTKARMEKLISQYGSLEEVHANYVCRKCRKELNVDKRGRAKPVKRKRKAKATSTFKRDSNGEVILPKWMINFEPRKRRACSAEELAKIDTCWRPDIWGNNKHLNKGKGCCNGCPCIERGSCGLKKVLVNVKNSKVKKVKKVAKKRKTRKKKNKS